LSRLGIVNSLSTSLDVSINAVVVAGGEGVQVVEAVKGDSIFGSIVAEGSSIAGDVAFSDIVGSLGTNEETVATKDGVSSEGRALRRCI
jgi:hypothetical protein